MVKAEQDFSNYHLADLVSGRETVYTLAGGVIPEIAARLGFPLGDEPNSQDLFGLVGALGKNKVLRDNEEVTAIDRDTAVDLVETAGVQKSLNRSLWTPEISAHDLDAVVLTGAVANWQLRGTRIVQNQVNPSVPAIVATGKRVMDTGTEQTNPEVTTFFAMEGRHPTETEFAREFVVPTLRLTREVRFSDAPHIYDSTKADEIAAELFRTNPELLSQKVGFARVANAGIQQAVQMRAAAREIDPDFDADERNPQVFVLTDSFPLARTAEEEAQPQKYQKALPPALRQTVLTGKMLHEAAGGE